MIQPTINNRVTSPYGFRNTPRKGFHQGIDFGAVIAGVAGDDIYAVADGVVKLARWQTNRRGFGRYIIIEHEGYCTVYAHLNGFNVKRGQRVTEGQVIGFMGTSGNSTGVHLHFGVFKCLYSQFFTKGTNGFKYPIPPVFDTVKIDYKKLYDQAQAKLDKIKDIL